MLKHNTPTTRPDTPNSPQPLDIKVGTPPIEDLEMIRTEAQLPDPRFVELIDLPRRTYHYRLARYRAGDPGQGAVTRSVVDRIEPLVAKYAGDWDALGGTARSGH